MQWRCWVIFLQTSRNVTGLHNAFMSNFDSWDCVWSIRGSFDGTLQDCELSSEQGWETNCRPRVDSISGYSGQTVLQSKPLKFSAMRAEYVCFNCKCNGIYFSKGSENSKKYGPCWKDPKVWFLICLSCKLRCAEAWPVEQSKEVLNSS